MSPRLDTSRTEGTISITTKGWSLDDLINYSVQFRSVRRVSATKLSPKELDHEITRFEKEGLPLIIEGYHQREGWLKNEFGVGWLLQHGPQDVRTRNVRDWTDGTMKTKEFFEYCRTASPYGTSAEPSRFYGKDVDCPQEWRKWLTGGGVVPSRLLEDNSENFMSHLPIDDPVETLMCYFGIGDTFTPAHKDLCASTGHNLMCYTEKSGSSFWFMTESSAAPKVTKYFHDLGQELDLETHVVSLDEFSKAPFVIYIAEQKLGDLVLVPPRSCHQVVNHGGLTVKTSWSRMTLDGLKTAFYHELPIYRRVCRPEIYRVKSIVHHSLRHYTRRLRSIFAGSETRFPTSSSRDVTAISRNTSTDTRSPTLCESRKCFQILSELLRLFDDILVEEYHPEHGKLEHVAPDSGNRLRWHHTCDFCGVDIFQSFFECRYCGSGSNEQGRVTGDGLIVCSSCYVEGRTCKCAHMTLAQRFNFDDLVEHRNEAARTLRAIAPEKGLTELSLDGSWYV
ncbi:hypothetical protein NEOLEDRAFT_1155897 [Neolentinus lepideus HHB14362 ss-1]|uniref:JmjC domain-containing protein n=1 Tax=Neolentinus lepideus HHB14362 ss-1 TaxID=1314782 RepID=A0A165TB78_9AGAM|nr:hypothetical protein NEOLEDRAFT_1155897 [Neolentinus lepideus HHB14362 ss-1]